MIATDDTPAAQMVQTANDQITDLQRTIADLERQIHEAHTELVAIAQAREARTHTLSMAQSEFERLEGEHNQAASYAKLANKTPNQQKAIKDASAARKAMQSAKSTLERLEREAIEAEQLASQREQELSRQVHLLQSEKETRHAEQETVQRGRSQAHAELGEAKKAAILQGYEAHEARCDAFAASLVAAQVDLHDYYEAAIQDLHDWPALQKEIADLQSVDDSTCRVIEATLLYVDTLLNDVNDLKTDFPRPSVQGGFSVWDVLLIPHAQVQWAHGELRSRREQIERLLNDYRAYLASQTLVHDASM